jgi:hypothetical protein
MNSVTLTIASGPVLPKNSIRQLYQLTGRTSKQVMIEEPA